MRSCLQPWSIVAVTLVVAFSLAVDAAARGHATPASYPSCGFYWNRNTPVIDSQRQVNACVVKAANGARKARAVAVYTTIEGDPIVNYVFVHGRRDLLVVVDSTRDRFGTRRWARYRCTSLRTSGGFLTWVGCRGVGTGKPAWLVVASVTR